LQHYGKHGEVFPGTETGDATIDTKNAKKISSRPLRNNADGNKRAQQAKKAEMKR